MVRPSRFVRGSAVASLALAFMLGARPMHGAIFFPLTVGDLIAAIITSNVNGQDDTIDLGGATFTLTTVNNITDGNNGLPSVADVGFSLTILNGVIERNTADPDVFRLLHVAAGGDLRLESLELRGGASTNGGAVFNNGSLTAVLVEFTSNRASVDGGAIRNTATGVLLAITECAFTQNDADASGGGISNAGVIATIERSTFSGNQGDNGAGLSNSGSIVVIANSTFSGGTTFIRGGGIENLTGGAIATLSNSTIAGNIGVSRGGGIYNDGTVTLLTSTIVAGNASTLGGPDIHEDTNGTIVSESFNFVGINSSSTFTAGSPNANNSYVGTSIAPLDPLLGPLQNNGGPTETRALLAGSLAIDNGSNPLALAFDQRGVGFVRESGAGEPDIGAFEVQPIADLGVTKSDTPDPVNAGANIVYTIQVTNNGPASAANVSLEDTLPTGTTFVSLGAPPVWSCSTPAVGFGGTVSCSIATLGLTTASFTLTVAVPAATPAGVLSNTASVSSDTADTDSGNDSAEAPTTVVVSAVLSVTKTDSPDPVTAGNNLAYTITVNNAGPSLATDVAWSDPLPVGTTFVSLTQPGGWSCTDPGAGNAGSVSCSISSLPAGNAQFTLTVAVSPLATGTLSNTVTVTPPVGGVTATADTSIVSSANLSVTKTDTPDPVAAGDDIAYTITVNNAGPSAASGVSLADTLPAGTTFVSLSAPGGWTCTAPDVGLGGAVSCTLTSFAPGPGAVFTLTVAVDSSVSPLTVLSNTATVSSSTQDPDGDDNDATAETTVVASANLSITKTDGLTSVDAGSSLVYSIVVSNAGPSDAPGSLVTDTFPADLDCSWTCAGTGTCAPAGIGNISDLVSLPDDASVTYTATCDVADDAFGSISNTATVAPSSSVTEVDDSDNSATDTDSVVTGADVSGTKTASGTFEVGSTITYTVVLTNTGIGPQGDNPGAEFTDVLPAELELVSATATSGNAVATTATNTVTWNGSIAAGASVTISITAAILPAAGNSSVSNQGTISVDSDGDGTNDASGNTDDPSTPAAADATVIAVGVPASEIPVLSPVSLVLLAGLLAMASAWMLSRRP